MAVEEMTDAQLRDAGIAAKFFRLVFDSKVAGLLEGGGEIDINRCDDILVACSRRGVELPDVDELLILGGSEILQGMAGRKPSD